MSALDAMAEIKAVITRITGYVYEVDLTDRQITMACHAMARQAVIIREQLKPHVTPEQLALANDDLGKVMADYATDHAQEALKVFDDARLNIMLPIFVFLMKAYIMENEVGFPFDQYTLPMEKPNQRQIEHFNPSSSEVYPRYIRTTFIRIPRFAMIHRLGEVYTYLLTKDPEMLLLIVDNAFSSIYDRIHLTLTSYTEERTI